MLSDLELFVILNSFYRSNDGVLISVIEKELKNNNVNRNGVVEEAIKEGVLKKITKVRVVLTKEYAEVWEKAKEEKIIEH